MQRTAEELFSGCVYCHECHRPIRKHIAELLRESYKLNNWYCYEHAAATKDKKELKK